MLNWVLVAIFIVCGVLTILGNDGCGWKILGVILALLGFSLFVALISDYEPTAEEIAQAQANYVEAYENTVILEDYTVGANVSFKKNGLFGGAITISGDITKANDVYSGNVTLDMPGNKYNYSYESPYGEIDTWASLNNGEKTIFLPFNVANLEAGIIQPLSEEIIATGVPTSPELHTVKFSVTNEHNKNMSKHIAV